MKELSIEDKANRYDKAIERAKSKIKNDKDHVLYEDDVIEIFPELKETESERIRKWLIEAINFVLDDGRIFHDKVIDEAKDAIAWLEKQRTQATLPQFTFEDILALQCCMETAKKVQEDKDLYEQLQSLHDRLHDAYWLGKQVKQKSVNKVESKFKVGDWVVLTAGDLSTTLQIANVDINKKLYWFNDGSYLPIVDEECLHLWTIEDAKDGDVLVASDGSIFIYKNQRDNGVVHYVAVTPYNDLVINENDYSWENKNACHPATKEQRDLLFAKMKEEGYEWNADKKKLIKL